MVILGELFDDFDGTKIYTFNIKGKHKYSKEYSEKFEINFESK